jgi:hypothetical protein
MRRAYLGGEVRGRRWGLALLCVASVLLIVIAVTVLWITTASATVQHARRTDTTRHCGLLKYGSDGKQPGPSGITAKNVSCWFARAVALLGPAPGWHCVNPIGIRFVCKRADAVVKFYGE